MSTAPAGGSIGPYRIVQPIGVGGWSTVYEVAAPDGRRLALKRLRDDLAPDGLARFRREVDSLRRLDHPGVVALVDAGLDGAAPYLVTPLIDGTSLRAALAAGPLGAEGALAIAIAAADAVAAIHAAGLVHRDLKPENLMLTPAGDVIVIDLGLALGAEHSRHTAEDTVTGSVPYLAPEQIDDRAPSPASDVWALGVVLFEAVAGRRPFQRARQAEEVAAILAGRAPLLTELAPGCPDELAALVARCLTAAPAQRPADGAALAAALRALVDWTDAAALRDERARLLADRAGYDAAIRARRVALVAAAAERALADGDRFAASRAIDRGLAYAPDDPALGALVERLMAAAPARPQQVTVKGHAPARMPSVSRPPASAPVGGAERNARGEGRGAESGATGEGAVMVGMMSAPAARRSRWPWGIAAGMAVVIALGVIAAAPWRTEGSRSGSGSVSGSGSGSDSGSGSGSATGSATASDPDPSSDAARLRALRRSAASLDPVEPMPGNPSSRPAHVAPSRPAPGRTPP